MASDVTLDKILSLPRQICLARGVQIGRLPSLLSAALLLPIACSVRTPAPARMAVADLKAENLIAAKLIHELDRSGYIDQLCGAYGVE